LKDLYNVTLAWGLDRNDGNYTASVWATGEDEAVRLTAEEMADAGQVKFDTKRERRGWIQERCRGFRDIYRSSSQLIGDLEALFAKELFADGPARGINLLELGKVLAENRERVLLPTAQSQAGYPTQGSG